MCWRICSANSASEPAPTTPGRRPPHRATGDQTGHFRPEITRPCLQNTMPGRGCARRCRRFERRRSQAREHRSTFTPTRTLETSADTTCETGGALKEVGDEYDDNEGHHRADPMGRPHLGRVAKASTVSSMLAHLLLAAKADPKMQHGEGGTMVESDLPFNRHTAHKLMRIAGDKRLTNVSQGKHLPPSWATLYELTKLDDATFPPCQCEVRHLSRAMRRSMLRFSRIVASPSTNCSR